jgi:hypothetical protein
MPRAHKFDGLFKKDLCEEEDLHGEAVSIMQAAQSGHRDNPAFRARIRFRFTGGGF